MKVKEIIVYLRKELGKKNLEGIYYLLENEDKHFGMYYYYLSSQEDGITNTIDPFEAVKFRNRERALQLCNHLNLTQWMCRYYVAEHMFI